MSESYCSCCGEMIPDGAGRYNYVDHTVCEECRAVCLSQSLDCEACHRNRKVEKVGVGE